MALNKSIFEFADKFGLESPFGEDWMAEEKAEREKRDAARTYQKRQANLKENAITITFCEKEIETEGKSQKEVITNVVIDFQAVILNNTIDDFKVSDAETLKLLIEMSLKENWEREIDCYSIKINTDIFIELKSENPQLVQKQEKYEKTGKRTLIMLESGMRSRDYALGELGGTYMKINWNNFFENKRDDDKLKNGISHEFGHLLGIRYHANEKGRGHINDDTPDMNELYNQKKKENPPSPDINPSYDETKDDKLNLMYSTYNTDKYGNNLAKGQILTVLTSENTLYRKHNNLGKCK